MGPLWLLHKIEELLSVLLCVTWMGSRGASQPVVGSLGLDVEWSGGENTK